MGMCGSGDTTIWSTVYQIVSTENGPFAVFTTELPVPMNNGKFVLSLLFNLFLYLNFET